MKKILVMLALTLSFLSAINVQTASKDELMCIKGIGDKKADSVLKYRKSHKLKSAEDLLEIKGFGEVLVKNVKNDVKSVACGGKKSTKTKSSKKDSTKKSSKSDKKESTKEKSKSSKKDLEKDSFKSEKKSSKKESTSKKQKSDKKSKSDKKEKKSSKSEKESSSKKSDK